MNARTVLCALLLIAVCTRTAAAQNCSAKPTNCEATGLAITMTIGAAFSMAVAPVTTGLTPPTPAHYDAGFAPTTGPTVTIQSNKAWTLAISSLAATWTANNTQTEPARTNKPASDLLWATALAGPYTPLTTTAVQFGSGAATASAGVNLFYRTTYAWALDTPGQYSIQIVFTAAAP